MVELPEEDKNRQKDFIVAKSQTLRIFIDKYLEDNFDGWLEALTSTYMSRRDEILNSLGVDKLDKDTLALLKDSNDARVFEKAMPEDIRMVTIFSMAWIGYEIGNSEEAAVIAEDILERVSDFGVIKKTRSSHIFVRDCLMCGVIWKEEELPNVFRDAIDKLNFNGL